MDKNVAQMALLRQKMVEYYQYAAHVGAAVAQAQSVLDDCIEISVKVNKATYFDAIRVATEITTDNVLSRDDFEWRVTEINFRKRYERLTAKLGSRHARRAAR